MILQLQIMGSSRPNKNHNTTATINAPRQQLTGKSSNTYTRVHICNIYIYIIYIYLVYNELIITLVDSISMYVNNFNFARSIYSFFIIMQVGKLCLLWYISALSIHIKTSVHRYASALMLQYVYMVQWC